MSCPDAPTVTIVNSAIAASRTKARATRSIFKRIVPPYFQFSLVCISHESLARPPQADGPLLLFAIWQVRKANEEPPLYYKTHGAPESFNRRSRFGPGPLVYPRLSVRYFFSAASPSFAANSG